MTHPVSDLPIPLEIHREDDRLLITWDEDHVGDYSARELRLACQCAECREEFTGRMLLDPASVPPDVRALSVSLVGGYGFQVHWSDGHHAGIYTYEFVLSQCPCVQCRGGGGGGGGIGGGGDNAP